jgi:hypothetical protein
MEPMDWRGGAFLGAEEDIVAWNYAHSIWGAALHCEIVLVFSKDGAFPVPSFDYIVGGFPNLFVYFGKSVLGDCGAVARAGVEFSAAFFTLGFSGNS